MFRLSKRTDYALLALQYLAREKGSGFTSTRAIAERFDIPLELLAKILAPTMKLRTGLGRSVLEHGYYASALRINDDLALACCTDGVGSKVLVAEMMGKFDTIGIDCVAVNVNDMICIGAEPIDGALVLRTPVSDPDVDLRLTGKLDLADVKKTVKLEGVNELAGRIAADVAVRTRMSSI